jgi:SAM-dependent methyltransferase
MGDEPSYRSPERYVALAGFETGVRDLWWNRDFLALLAQRHRTRDAADVLDVGCGTGEWGRTVIRDLAPAARLTGIDREAHFVELARAKARSEDRFEVAPAEALPFADESFDLVTCQTVLIHVPDAAAVVHEMIRVLRPGGLMLLAEPDNLAGAVALLGGSPAPADEDIEAITALLLACQRGKRALGEGDDRIGAVLPGLLAAAGLTEVTAHTNDRCMSLHPPYDSAAMQLSLTQERAWARDDVTILLAARDDAQRFARAGGWDVHRFEVAWGAVRRWMDLVETGVIAGSYHSARAFVMVVTAGRK